jgi:hypothetical protein
MSPDGERLNASESSFCLFCGNVYDLADEAEHGLNVCLLAYVERNGWLIPIDEPKRARPE